MLEFATHTWDGWDYIPRAWDEWLEASDGVLLVGLPGDASDGAATLDAEGQPLSREQPVAVARVAMLSPTEAWLEGIRVHPRVRGMDVATDLQVAELHVARALGASVVRYATSSRNEGSHRLGARHGFELLSSLRTWRWSASGLDEDDDDATGFDPGARRMATDARQELLARLGEAGLALGTEDAAVAWARLSEDATFRAGHGLYEYRAWAVQELTAEAFREHVAHGEVLGTTPSENGWALAVLPREALPAEDVSLHLALLLGDPAAVLRLSTEIRSAAGAPLRFRVPDAGSFDSAGFESGGFVRRDWTLDILGSSLADGHQPPPADSRRVQLRARLDAI